MRLAINRLVLSTSLLLGTLTPAWADSAIIIEDAFVRATPPGQSNSAAFMRLKNSSDQAVNLTTAASDVADKVELHGHQHDNGVMRMRQMMSITLPPQTTTALEPGGLHIMLLGLHSPLVAGEQIELNLSFSNGETQTVTLPIQMPGGHGAGHQHH
ncbi:copper chaperone PCu(A)C [Neptuniibacter sp. CAU 1671]|uniref:copper chaperone PCu(A)C n=1 Tax=Neptuniibacter sp. CAU 1671 TaxID=3032593 RepID=UPI0023DA1EE0|nr:copper chaperone PCu(A)C [Neptuniibacter sp. CAU 1671]MDF2182776.1 copper chaperone PCu(A)C [Neptuniibacter sp. CAU 1671]